MASIAELRALGQSLWLDYIDRGLITSGRLARLVEQGVSGVTSNPTIFEKALRSGRDYDQAIRALVEHEPDIATAALAERLMVEDVRLAADVLHPVYEASAGADGYVSLEVSPRLAHDTDGTVAEARRLWQAVDRPNLMIKVPATPAGLPAITALLAAGVNVNVTLLFSIPRYEEVLGACLAGFERHPRPQALAAVTSFFVSRIDGKVDPLLARIGTDEARSLQGRVAIACARLAYRRFRRWLDAPGFAAQRARGARIPRLLWGSTSTKNPAYRDVLYVEELIGPDTVNTVPPETLAAFLDHGRARAALAEEEGVRQAEAALAALERLGIDLGTVTRELEEEGVRKFAESYERLLAGLEEKRRALAAAVEE